MTRSPTRSVFAALAIALASVCGACSSPEADTPAENSGATGAAAGGNHGGGHAIGGGGTTGTAGTPANSGTGGQGAGSGSAGAPVLGGEGGRATNSGGSAGMANPEGGMGGGGKAGSAGNASGGIGGLAAGVGGAAGTGAYHPCPSNGTPCKILPFGDSITRGAKSSDDAGYRSPLYKLILAAKQKATFTGSASNGPSQVSGQPFPRSHEGHAGWTIDPGYNMISSSYSGISKLLPSPALDANPNIILLMIGTNDLFARDTANMATRLEALLDKIVQGAPNALIVLAQLTPLGHSDANLTAYNAKIPGIVQARAAKGQHIIGVDMSKLPTSQLADGTHPTDQGYAYMANIWYPAIKDLLPQ